MKKKSTKLTVKQQKFADEYIITGNATQSALTAGYAPKAAYQTGAENLKKPQIKEYIDAQLEKLKSDKVDTQQQIMEFLSAVRRGEVTESVTTAKRVFDNVPVGAKDRIKAAELLGKRFGMWTDNVNLTNTDIHLTIGGDDDGD